MKNILYILLLISMSALSQSNDQNYVKSEIYTTPDNDAAQARKSITYYDGLGRAVQQIQAKASNEGKDIITHVEYDIYNRQPKQYLPYASTGDMLRYDSNAKDHTLAYYMNPKYDNTMNPYSEQVFETSSLNRVLQQAAPGEKWKIGGSGDVNIKFDYQTNVKDSVRNFKVSFLSDNSENPELTVNGFYRDGQLYKNIVKDEFWVPSFDKYRTTEEFKDKEGKLILKRNYTRVPSFTPEKYLTLAHDTYYVYDDYSNLTFVIPPLAADKIIKETIVSLPIRINFPWTKLMLYNEKEALRYETDIKNYTNEEILDVDLFADYGRKGGFSIEFFDNGSIAFGANIVSKDPFELKNGVIADLQSFGKFEDRELGKIVADNVEYYLLIEKNALVISGYGLVNSPFVKTISEAPLDYQQNFPWTSFLKIDKSDSDIRHFESLLQKFDNSEILSVYIDNNYRAKGGAAISFAADDIFKIDVDIHSDVLVEFDSSALFTLDTKRPIPDGVLGTVKTEDYDYTFTVKDNMLEITGEGLFNEFIFHGLYRTTKMYSIEEDALQLCYIYHYDYRNRMISKHIPDNGWTNIIYDKLDRPVLTQDENLKFQNKWLYTKYDAMGRIALTGETSNLGDCKSIQDNYNNGTYVTGYVQRSGANNNFISQDGANIYYVESLFPQNGKILTANYYDDINFETKVQIIDSSGVMPGNSYTTFTNKLKGLKTGGLVRVLTSDVNGSQQTNAWITNFTAYDEKARPVWIYSYNNYLNAWHMVESKLDFRGIVQETKAQHKTGSNPKVVVHDYFTYDNADRPLTHQQFIGDNCLTCNRELISDVHYDALGVMEHKSVGGLVSPNAPNTITNPLQTIDYTQNIRGWLTGINSPENSLSLSAKMFAFNIDYLPNGNISETSWKTAIDNNTKSYNYSYDGLNRLTAANFENKSNINELYHEKGITYDKNGNIMSLSRWGLNSNNSFSKLDELVYAPQTMSNRLVSVVDNIPGTDGFNDFNRGSNDYDYDVAGNLTKDLNKGIIAIHYNHLNMPTEVIKDEHHKVEYVYDATGAKQLKKVTDGAGNITTTVYSYGFVYKNNQLEYFSHPEGYVKPIGNQNFEYVYQYKDHLGNVRLSYADSDRDGTVADAQHFEDGFESDTGWDDSYYLSHVVRDSTVQHSGKYSGRLKSENTNTANPEVYCHSNQWISINNSQATDYTYSCWIKSDGPEAEILLFMKSENETGYFTNLDYTRVGAGTGNWIKIEKTVSVAPEIRKLNIRLDTNSNGTVWFDDVSIKRADGKTEIVDNNDYYPFGMKHAGGFTLTGNSANKIKYNGKELQDELELNMYDYGARNYDPAIGRWFNIDPLAEKHKSWSPYNYTINNPLSHIDPDGRDIENITGGVRFTGEDAKKAFTSIKNQIDKKEKIKGIHFVKEADTPNIYRHTLNSFRKGKPNVLHYDSNKAHQAERRKESLKNYPSRAKEGLQADEYPYASTYEGGGGADVTYVPASENRSQGGSLGGFGGLYRTLDSGDAFLVLPVPKNTEPERVPEPIPVRSPFMQEMSEVTGLTGTALLIYVIVSEGTRLFPLRNLVPIP